MSQTPKDDAATTAERTLRADTTAEVLQLIKSLDGKGWEPFAVNGRDEYRREIGDDHWIHVGEVTDPETANWSFFEVRIFVGGFQLHFEPFGGNTPEVRERTAVVRCLWTEIKRAQLDVIKTLRAMTLLAKGDASPTGRDRRPNLQRQRRLEVISERPADVAGVTFDFAGLELRVREYLNADDVRWNGVEYDSNGIPTVSSLLLFDIQLDRYDETTGGVQRTQHGEQQWLLPLTEWAAAGWFTDAGNVWRPAPPVTIRKDRPRQLGAHLRELAYFALVRERYPAYPVDAAGVYKWDFLELFGISCERPTEDAHLNIHRAVKGAHFILHHGRWADYSEDYSVMGSDVDEVDARGRQEAAKALGLPAYIPEVS